VQGGKRRRADSSTERYAGIVRCFLEILGPEADRSLRLIAPFHIERFVNHRLDQGRAPKTISVDTRILGIAFHRAERYGYIDKNPVPVIQLPKVVSTEREPFTYAEIEQLVAAASNLDWQTVILLGAYTGARLGDCVAATWEQVDAEHDLISLRQTKTGKPVILPIHPRLGRHLAHVAEQHATGPLAPSLASKTPGGKHGLSEGFKRIARRAGVDLRIVQGKGRQQFAKRTFHSLRHTFVSALANADVPMEVSMAATGHVSADIHKRYWHLQQERLRRAIWKLADADPNRPA
jgi:integrase